jgi:imidazolonepropionase
MDELTILENAAIVVKGHQIIDVGAEDELMEKYNYFEMVNLNGAVVLPGLIDSHTHPVFWHTREAEFEMRLQGKSYEEIAASGGGIQNSVTALREASADELFDISMQRIAKFLEYGTTTIEAKSGYGLSLDDELKSLRVIRRLNNSSPLDLIPTFLGAHDVPKEYKQKRNDYISLLINEMIPKVAEEKLAVYCDVFCETGVFSVDESELILETAKKYGMIPRVHADELTPLGGAELAAKVGAASADHLLQISDAGIEALKNAHVTATLLPGTAFFIRKPTYAPARKMIDAGCAVALATDFNPGSSYTQNLQFIMSLACLNMGMMPTEVINAVTKNAAKSLTIFDRVGSIEVGKDADFIVMDVPNYKAIVYNYAINHVVATYKKGQKI